MRVSINISNDSASGIGVWQPSRRILSGISVQLLSDPDRLTCFPLGAQEKK